MPSLNHVHTYERIPNRPDYYRCKHADCTGIFERILLFGKRARCECGRDFILTPYSLRRKNPHCDYCYDATKATKGRSKKIQEMPDLIKDLDSVINKPDKMVYRGEEI